MSGVSVHMKPGLSAKTRVTIMTVDPTTRRLEGAMKDGSMIQIAVREVPAAFVWPQVGETWLVRKDSGIWMLDCRQQYSADATSLDITTMSPGEMILDSNTVVIRNGTALATHSDLAPLVTQASLSPTVTALPLASNWTNYGSGWAPPAYWKDALGMVHLRGLVSWTGSSGPPTPVATLPSGYVPLANELFAVRCAASGAEYTARVDVYPSGEVLLEHIDGGTTVDWLGLSGIAFLAGV